MGIEHTYDYQVWQCECGSISFYLLRSGAIRCKDCEENKTKFWDWNDES